MTTALTSIAEATDPSGLAKALPGRHLHLRGAATAATPRSPYFVDLWTRVADVPLEECPSEDAVALETFVARGGRLELCEATTYPRPWSCQHLFGALMVREFALRDLEQPLTEASFERCLRPGVWFAIAWRDAAPVAIAVLQPCALPNHAARGMHQRVVATRDRLVLAAMDEQARRALLAALPSMAGAHGAQWLRARRRPWAVTDELEAWERELDHACELVFGFRDPGDVLLFRPELLRADEAVVFVVESSGPGQLSVESAGSSDVAGRVCRRLNTMIHTGKIRCVGR